MSAVDEVLKLLRDTYGASGKLYELNDVQITLYRAELSPYGREELFNAARGHIRSCNWFPKLSELLKRLGYAEASPDQMAQLAWLTVERAIRQVGAYRSVRFLDPSIGVTVRQVFGTWGQACSYDTDSPGWAMRKQTFLSVFPTNLRATEIPTIGGLHGLAAATTIPHVAGLPAAVGQLEAPDQSRDVLAEVTRRFALKAAK